MTYREKPKNKRERYVERMLRLNLESHSTDQNETENRDRMRQEQEYAEGLREDGDDCPESAGPDLLGPHSWRKFTSSGTSLWECEHCDAVRYADPEES